MSSKKRPPSESPDPVGSRPAEASGPMGAAAASSSATAQAVITLEDVLNSSVMGSGRRAKRLKSEVLTQVPIDIESLDLRGEFVRLALAAHSVLSVALLPFGCPRDNLGALIRRARQEDIISRGDADLLNDIRERANEAKHIFE